jgi:hypothetical protein
MSMFSFFRKSKNVRLQKKEKRKKSKVQQTQRQTLIKDAILIHKKQSKLLDNLSEATKNQLREFAMKSVFNIKEKD